jgi:hypothetical protein
MHAVRRRYFVALHSPFWDACVLRIVHGKRAGGAKRSKKGAKEPEQRHAGEQLAPKKPAKGTQAEIPIFGQ